MGSGTCNDGIYTEVRTENEENSTIFDEDESGSSSRSRIWNHTKPESLASVSDLAFFRQRIRLKTRDSLFTPEMKADIRIQGAKFCGSLTQIALMLRAVSCRYFPNFPQIEFSW